MKELFERTLELRDRVPLRYPLRCIRGRRPHTHTDRQTELLARRSQVSGKNLIKVYPERERETRASHHTHSEAGQGHDREGGREGTAAA